eukprot:COSAG06_NODE_1507_length_9245_cov_17.379073_1_plen_178_part_00
MSSSGAGVTCLEACDTSSPIQTLDELTRHVLLQCQFCSGSPAGLGEALWDASRTATRVARVWRQVVLAAKLTCAYPSSSRQHPQAGRAAAPPSTAPTQPWMTSISRPATRPRGRTCRARQRRATFPPAPASYAARLTWSVVVTESGHGVCQPVASRLFRGPWIQKGQQSSADVSGDR